MLDGAADKSEGDDVTRRSWKEDMKGRAQEGR